MHDMSRPTREPQTAMLRLCGTHSTAKTLHLVSWFGICNLLSVIPGPFPRSSPCFPILWERATPWGLAEISYIITELHNQRIQGWPALGGKALGVFFGPLRMTV
ncbi:hypothetical protein V6Z77_004239 [Aspergillus fumigatus]